jgi:cytochrome c oxidase subunit 2
MNLQSTLSPAGPQAAHIASLWWWFLGTTTVVAIIVLAALAWAVVRGRSASNRETNGTAADSGLGAIVTVSVGVTIVVLFALLIGSIAVARVLAARPGNSAVSIALTGHQWWWEIEYEDAVQSRHVITANEMHIPVGRPVVLKVTSRDVIHSFWVPNLAGKRDLIPGYTTAIWIQADRAAIYRGQCAEFCGRQHANMAIEVVAQPESDFEGWLENERQVARPPADATAQHGLDVFASGQCIACHSIAGTLAHGQIGPDLTHMAARRTIGAGALPNTRERMAEWVVNPQASKPGSLMPPNILPEADVQALVTYLEGLK